MNDTSLDFRNDALGNVLTGLGGKGDRAQATRPIQRSDLSVEELEMLLRDPTIERICSAYPEDAVKKGVEFTLGGDDGKDFSKETEAMRLYCSTLAVRGERLQEEILDHGTISSEMDAIAQAQFLANVYGGAGILIDIDDGVDPSEPIQAKKIKTIRGLHVLDRWQISPEAKFTLDWTNPTHYRLNLGNRPETLNDGEFISLVHRSRVLRFDGRNGRKMPSRVLQRNSGWGQSSIDAVWEVWRDYATVFQYLSNMIADCSLFVYKLRGLRAAIEAGHEDKLRRRFQSLRQSVDVLGGAALDADGEDVQWATRTFAGLPELTDRFKDLLIAATEMPLSIIFGRGATGLAAQGTGETEAKIWAGQVENYQKTALQSHLRHLYTLVWLAKDGPTKGKIPEDWDFRFPSLIVQSEAEKTAWQASWMNTLMGLAGSQPLLTVDEARNSMFAGAEFSSDVKLDKDEWEKAKKKAEEEAAAQQGGGFDYASLMGGEEAPPEGELPPEQADPAAQQVQQDSWWTTFRRSDATYPKVYDQAAKTIARQYRNPRSVYAKAALAHNYVEGCRRETGTDRGVLRTDSTQQSAIVLRSWFSRQWQQLG
jgi:uncharacterized protein